MDLLPSACPRSPSRTMGQGSATCTVLQGQLGRGPEIARHSHARASPGTPPPLSCPGGLSTGVRCAGASGVHRPHSSRQDTAPALKGSVLSPPPTLRMALAQLSTPLYWRKRGLWRVTVTWLGPHVAPGAPLPAGQMASAQPPTCSSRVSSRKTNSCPGRKESCLDETKTGCRPSGSSGQSSAL